MVRKVRMAPPETDFFEKNPGSAQVSATGNSCGKGTAWLFVGAGLLNFENSCFKTTAPRSANDAERGAEHLMGHL